MRAGGRRSRRGKGGVVGELAFLAKTKSMLETEPRTVQTDNRRVPTVSELSPRSASVDASSVPLAVIPAVLDHRVDEMYDTFNVGLRNAIEALKEPPPQHDDGSFALKVLASLVEGITGFAFSRFGALVSNGMKGTLAQPSVDAVKDVFRNFGREASQAASKRLTAAGHLRQTRQLPNIKRITPASGLLIDEYRTRQEHALVMSRHEAHIKIAILAAELSRIDETAARRLGDELGSAADTDHAAAFEYEIVTGWMNFRASLALGEKPADQETAMAGASGQRGVASSDDADRAAWALPHDGFVEIAVHVPDEIDGLKGLALKAVTVGLDGPGAARTLRQMDLPLLSVPAYRRVTVRTGPTALEWVPAFVLTPEGRIEVDSGNRVLAAIGNGRRTPNFGLNATAEPAMGRPTAGELVLADDAHKGADAVTKWLAQFRTTEIAE